MSVLSLLSVFLLHWRFARIGPGRGQSPFRSITSIFSRTFWHFFAVLHLWWLSRNFNHSAYNYQIYPHLGISIWWSTNCILLIDFMLDLNYFTKTSCRFKLVPPIILVIQMNDWVNQTPQSRSSALPPSKVHRRDVNLTSSTISIVRAII